MGRKKINRLCTIPNCELKHRAVGLCMKHYLLTYRLRLIDLLGGEKCMRCGFSDIRALQIEHINGGGTKQFKENGTYSVYAYYLNHPEKAKRDLQVFCANCNWIKKSLRSESRKMT